MKLYAGRQAMSAIVSISAVFALASCSIFGIRSEEQPPYRVIEEEGAIQVRQYGKTIVARTEVKGNYDDTTSEAFRRVSGYIFGKNKAKTKIAMTAPVVQEKKGREIPMTAPVFQEKSGDAWTMSFVMPSKYTVETLPEPLDPRVELVEVREKKVAAVRYSGFRSEERIAEQSLILLNWLEKKGYRVLSPPRYAGYDPPWTIPFLRRNEVMMDIE